MTTTILPQERRPRHLGTAGGRLASAIITFLARRISWGTIVLTSATGTTQLGNSEPTVRVTIHDNRVFGALGRRGSIGLGESYIEGWWDVDDLTTLIRILERAIDPIRSAMDRSSRFFSPLTTPLRRYERTDKDKDRSDVQAHYDLSNEFYSLMLDETMAYSCGYFENLSVSLGDASRAKLDRICQKLSLSPNDHVIEIGTGWASFAVHAAKNYGCRITTTTISDAQYEFAAKRIADEGVGDLVTVINRDYRDLDGVYDKLVSIEMIEAIGWRQLDTFFSTCERLLKPNGLMGLQAIVIEDRSYERAKNHQDLIKELVFPGSFLPSMKAMDRSIRKNTNFRTIQVEEIGLHYAETLRRWLETVEDNAEKVEALGLDERFRRLWRMYLCYCEAAFRERHVSDVQMVLARSGYGGPLEPGGFREVGA